MRGVPSGLPLRAGVGALLLGRLPPAGVAGGAVTATLDRATLERVCRQPGGTHALRWAGTEARLDQLWPEGEWRCWLLLGGRGAGKTRTLVETVRDRVWRGSAKRVALVAATAADARDVLVEGESGVLACAPADFRPVYEPSKRRLTWPNGAIGTLYSAEEPDRLRGPQHDFAIADEVAAWREPQAWDMLLMGLRLPPDPRVVAATTPRPTPLIRALLDDAGTAVSRATTYDNLANLAPAFRERVLARYEGTRLGRQELMGELLLDTPGALWTWDMLAAARGTVPERSVLAKDRSAITVEPDLTRVVVAVDPATTSGEDSDETGIVVAARGADGRGYVLADRSCRMSPDGWAHRAVAAYREFGADRIVAESNQGGQMVEHTLRTVDPRLPIRLIHAAQGKRLRAEPVAALYEQGRVTHAGDFVEMEAQMTGWTPDSGQSPDRLDALVHALTDLLLGAQAPVLRCRVAV